MGRLNDLTAGEVDLRESSNFWRVVALIAPAEVGHLDRGFLDDHMTLSIAGVTVSGESGEQVIELLVATIEAEVE